MKNIRLIIVLSFISLFVLSVFACDLFGNSSDYDISNVTLVTGPGLNILYENYRFPFLYGNSRNYWEFYDYFLLKSVIEKNELITRWITEFEDLGISDWSLSYYISSFDRIFGDYGEMFFEENNLVLILMTEPSGSNRIEVRSVGVRNNELNISINRFVPSMGMGVMAYWYILIPVKKDFFNGNTVNVEISTRRR